MWLIVWLMLFFSYPVQASLCVEDNFSKCAALGFTEKKCDYGGVACYFEPSLWHCAKWTCADGNFYTEADKPAGADCNPVSYKGMECFNCITNCPAGSVDYSTCWGGKLALLTDKPEDCSKLGYIHNRNSCTNYLVCPADTNKVRCFN